MDEVRAFLNHPMPSKSQVIKLRGPLTGGFRITHNDEINELNRKEEHRFSNLPSGMDYAKEVKKRETEMYLRVNSFNYKSCFKCYDNSLIFF